MVKHLLLTICCAAAVAAAAQEPTVVPGVYVAPAAGGVSLTSATTDTDGDSLAVTFSDTVTLTDTTGWSVTTNAGASVLLTGVSGSGTSTLTFTCEPRIGSTVTATLDYDSGTGNAVGVGDLSNQAITNNSKKPIPPVEYEVPSIPATLAGLESGATVINVANASELTSLLTGGTVDGTTLAAAAGNGPVVIKLAVTTYDGEFTFPALGNDDWIYVVSANYDSLPAAGTRTAAADRTNMPLFQALTTRSSYNYLWATLHLEFAAQKYRFVGISATYPGTKDGLSLFNAGKDHPDLGDTIASDTDIPRDIILDRCEFYGRDGLTGTDRKGVNFDVLGGAIIDSRVVDIAGNSSDDPMGIMVTFGGSNLTYQNLEVTASGENIIFGGTDGYRDAHENLVMRDLWLHKPRHWFLNDPSYDGTNRTIKNLLELKKASKALVEGCVLEDCGDTDASQTLSAFVLTARNQSGTDPNAVVEHVEIRNCLVRRVGMMCQLIGEDNNNPSLETNHTYMHDVLYYDQNYYAQYGESKYPAISISQLYAGKDYPNLRFEHITCVTSPDGDPYAFGNFFRVLVSTSDISDVLSGLVVRDNIFDGYPASTLREALYFNYSGGGWSPATGIANLCTDDAIVSNNLAMGEDATEQNRYPAGNYFETDYTTVGFADYPGATNGTEPADFALTSGDYRAGGTQDATDGTDMGPDISAIEAAISGVAP